MTDDRRTASQITDAELTALYDAKERAEAERDGAYRERAQLLAWLALIVPAVLAPAPDVDEDGWHLLYLTPGGTQLSWHIAPADVDLFRHVEHVGADDPRAQWDGHTTDEKYERVRSLTFGELRNQCGPECSEMHTGVGRCLCAPADGAEPTEAGR